MATKPTATRSGFRLPGRSDAQKPATKSDGSPRRWFQFKFGGEVLSELRKVTWPTWLQVRDLTMVVIVISVAVGAILGGIDYLFSKIIEITLLNPPV